MRLTEGKYNSRYQAASIGKNRFSYIADNNGILNRYTAVFDSAISYIDTTTHYRYFINSVPATNYDRNILNQSVIASPDNFGELLLKEGKYNLRKGQLSTSDQVSPDEMVVTGYRKERDLMFHKADSIEEIRKWLLDEYKRMTDTLTKPLYEYYAKDEPINISHYIFEKEKQNYYDELWRKKYMDIDLDTGRIDLPLIRIYETSFYNN